MMSDENADVQKATVGSTLHEKVITGTTKPKGVLSTTGKCILDDSEVNLLRPDSALKKRASATFMTDTFMFGASGPVRDKLRTSLQGFIDSGKSKLIYEQVDNPHAKTFYNKVCALGAASGVRVEPGSNGLSAGKLKWAQWRKGALYYMEQLKHFAGNVSAYMELFPAMTEDEAAAAAAAAAEQLEATARDLGLEVDELKQSMNTMAKRVTKVEGRLDGHDDLFRVQGEANEGMKADLRRHSADNKQNAQKLESIQKQYADERRIAAVKRVRASLRAKSDARMCGEARAALERRRSQLRAQELGEARTEATALRARVAELEAAVESHVGALAAARAEAVEAVRREKADREDAESVLQATIEAETAARERDVEECQEGIAAETAARQEGDANAALAISQLELHVIEGLERAEKASNDLHEKLEELRSNATRNLKFLRGSFVTEMTALRDTLQDTLSRRIAGVSEASIRRAAKLDAKLEAKLEELKAFMTDEILPPAIERTLFLAGERAKVVAKEYDQINRDDTLANLKRLREASKNGDKDLKNEILVTLAERVAGVSEGSIRRDVKLEKLFHVLLSAERALTRADSINVKVALDELAARMAELEAVSAPVVAIEDLD